MIGFDPVRHLYTWNGKPKPSVTQVLSASGRLQLDGIPEDILRRAALRGTRVHKAAALLLRGNLDWSTVDEQIGGYVLAFDKFLRETRIQPIPETIEQPLYCAQYDYCGTPDVLGLGLNAHGKPRLVVLDWKTGMMHAVRFQLAAYAHVLKAWHRTAVKLNKNGTYSMTSFPPETLKQDLAVFVNDLDMVRREGKWAA